MGLRISTNVASINAQRQLGQIQGAQKETLEHLSSGTRINKAADDAAGLGISEKMRGDIRSVRQDVKNANDGVSMIQTAEGGMNEIGNILIQASSDTLGDSERGFIDKEVQQLKSEVSRIAGTTEFNGKKLLNGTGEALEFQVGIHNNANLDRFKFETRLTDLEGLGLSNISTTTKEAARKNLEVVDTAVQRLTDNRAELGALQNRLTSVVNNLNVYDENLSAARSRIRDTDMASETAEMTKNNILSQAGISVLSQANQNSMIALKLLS